MSGAVKRDFQMYIWRYTSTNENFAYGYPHFNALLQFELKLERCKPHKPARHPTKCDVINDFNLFRTVYRRIYCRKFLTLYNHTSRYNLKCIRINIYTPNWAMAWDFQQCGRLTCVDSDKPVQPPFRFGNSKWWSVSSLIVIEYSSDKQRLWSDFAYAQADLRLCWSHIPYCWKSHAAAQFLSLLEVNFVICWEPFQTVWIYYTFKPIYI